MPFRIATTKSFKRRLRKKRTNLQGAILKTIELLGSDPFHPGLRSKRIQGAPGEWEARIDGKNRLSWRYGAQPGVIELLNHCTHDQVLP